MRSFFVTRTSCEYLVVFAGFCVFREEKYSCMPPRDAGNTVCVGRQLKGWVKVISVTFSEVTFFMKHVLTGKTSNYIVRIL